MHFPKVFCFSNIFTKFYSWTFFFSVQFKTSSFYPHYFSINQSRLTPETICKKGLSYYAYHKLKILWKKNWNSGDKCKEYILKHKGGVGREQMKGKWFMWQCIFFCFSPQCPTPFRCRLIRSHPLVWDFSGFKRIWLACSALLSSFNRSTKAQHSNAYLFMRLITLLAYLLQDEGEISSDSYFAETTSGFCKPNIAKKTNIFFKTNHFFHFTIGHPNLLFFKNINWDESFSLSLSKSHKQ